MTNAVCHRQTKFGTPMSRLKCKAGITCLTSNYTDLDIITSVMLSFKIGDFVSQYRYIEKCPDINFAKAISDIKWIYAIIWGCAFIAVIEKQKLMNQAINRSMHLINHGINVHAGAN